ncbi:unnamed protein product [Effrenium voratum]|nr:unnamed protein product [Effrenium voratum]
MKCHKSRRLRRKQAREKEREGGRRPAAGSGPPLQMQQQLNDLDEMEVIAAQRSSEIAQIASSVVELNRIFKDLATLVIDQGSVLDRIDCNTEKIYQKSHEAKGQLHLAVKRKKESDSRAWRCLLVWGSADLILLIVLLVKYQLKYGLKNVAIFLAVIGLILTVCYCGVKQYQPKVLTEVAPGGYLEEAAWQHWGWHEPGLAGRSIHEVKDLGLAEQLYLYERTRRFKARRASASIASPGPKCALGLGRKAMAGALRLGIAGLVDQGCVPPGLHSLRRSVRSGPAACGAHGQNVLAASISVDKFGVISKMVEQAVTNVVWSTGQLLDDPARASMSQDLRKVLPVAVARFRVVLQSATPRELANTCWGLALSDYHDAAFYEAVAAKVANEASEWRQAGAQLDLPALVCAFARVKATGHQKLLDAVSKKMSPALTDVNNWGICAMTWSYKQLDTGDDFLPFRQTLAAEVARRGLSQEDLERSRLGPEKWRKGAAEHPAPLSAEWDSLRTRGCRVPVISDADVEERVDNPDSTVYLIFMEDTVKMLSVYSTQRSVFIIRSALEGVCSWLRTAMGAHAQRMGVPNPSFVNAGDGLFTHPIGEFVDIFSLLEHRRWDRSAVHLALVGDLAHGRTAHSKVEGLKVFDKVRVDLVAPEIFEYPVEYRDRMRQAGFEVQEFSSVEDYLEKSKDIADVWYFYKPQFSKCGDLSSLRLNELRSQVSFREEWLPKLPKGVTFFQTLPRDKEHPIIPLSLDTLSINGWDTVAANAYFLDVVLLSMLFGKIGRDLAQPSMESSLLTGGEVGGPQLAFCASAELPYFIKEVALEKDAHLRNPERARAGGPVPISDGCVLDHLGLGPDSTKCWEALRKVRTILGWSKTVGSEGVYSSKGNPGFFKGILTLPGFDYKCLRVQEVKMMASVAPGCTFNCVNGSKVVAKYRLQVPERIDNLPNISCKNSLCVSHPKNRQREIVPYLERVPYYVSSVLPNCPECQHLYVCKWCRWPHIYENIWDDLRQRQ